MKKLFIILLSIASFNIGFSQFTEIPLPTNTYLHSVYFMTADTGLLLGGNGNILRTTNGGNSWDSIPSGFQSWLNTAHFFNKEEGFIAGGANFAFPPTYPSNLILKTDDGGQTFDSLYADYSGGDFLVCDFADENHGMFLGSFHSFITADGGQSFDTLFINPSLFYVSGRAIDYQTQQLAHLVSVEYINQLAHEVVIYKTLNQGQDWSVTHRDTIVNFATGVGLDFTSPMVGHAMTSHNYHRTVDGGETWQTSVLDSNMFFNSLEFISPSVGFALATKVGENSTYLFVTEDGGQNWTSNYIDTMFASSDMSVAGKYIYISDYQRLFKYEIDSALLITSVSDLVEIKMSLFPNPAKEILHFECTNCKQNSSLQVIDLNGRVILEQEIHNTSGAVELPSYCEGIYFVKVMENGMDIATSKVIIK